LLELTDKREWDSKLFDTGRVDEKERPIYGTKLQNGLHDIEPDGSFVDINTLFQPHAVGVSTDRVIRNRCGEVRASDTGSESKDLAKVKTKNLCGVSLKLKGYRTYGPHFDDLKSTYYTTNNGITLKYYPNYKGVNIVIVIDNPQIASNVYRFSIQEYGCSYTYEKIEGGIKCISSTGQDDIYIKALYVKDANDGYGSVDIDLDGVEDGRQIIKKTIAPVWLGNAVGPVESDPSVTIDDDTGTFEDAISYNGLPDNNYGAWDRGSLFNQATNKQSTFIKVLLTSLAGKTVVDSYFGFDVFGNTFPVVGNAHVILVPWGEGNKNGAAASAGELTYNSSEHSISTWNTANCKGDGTDRVAAVDGTYTFTGINSDTHFPVSSGAVQGMIDSPATNYGWVFETLDIFSRTIAWRSSEAVIGNKPYIYVEYTEGAAAQQLAGIFGLGRLGIR
jgi:hypothetical protein